MATPIVSREEALRLGLAHYFTGIPCKHGHIDRRYIANGRCMECHRISANPNAQRRTLARKEAQRLGLVRYYTGRPCKFGHLVERYVDGGGCVECVRLRALKIGDRWVKAHPDRYREYQAEYREQNKTHLSQEHRRRYLENREYRIAYSRKFHANNPHVARAARIRRRARRKGATGTHTATDIKALVALQSNHCAECRRSLKGGYHVDHIKPLSRGGSNDRYNLQLLCPECNLRKRASDPIEWAQRNGRLL